MNKVYGEVISVRRRITASSSAGSGVALDALVALPDETSNPVVAVIKLFSAEDGSKGLFNELAAYSVYRKLRAPVAYVLPVVCDVRLLKEYLTDAELKGRSGYTLCVASVRVREAVRRTTDLPSGLLNGELVSWRDIDVAAVADELLLNADRTPQNLLRVGGKTFVLIDHERIMLGPHWTSAEIQNRRSKPSPGNHLARLLLGSSNDVGKKRLFGRCAEVESNFELSPGDFRPEIEELTRVPSGTLDALIECVSVRSGMVGELIGRQAELDQLHYSAAS